MNRKIFAWFFAIVLLFSSINLIGCTVRGEAVTYVNFGFNPNIEFVLDTGNRIVSVNSLNDEGELLTSYGDFEGKEIKNVISILLKAASESGILNVNTTDGVVYITVANEDATYAESLFQNLKDVCNNYFKSNGIYAFAAASQLPEEVITLASEYNVSVGHLRLMLKLKELNPDITWEELVAMPIRDVVASIHSYFNSFGRIASQTKAAYKAERLALKQAYENSLRTLFGTQYATLLDELALLESQIEMAEGEALENLKIAIENKTNQINTLRNSLEVTYQTEYQALKAQYEADKKALFNEYTQNYAAQKAARKTALDTRIAENKNKLQARINYAKMRTNNFASRYDTFLALKEVDILNFLQTQLTQIEGLNADVLQDLQNAILEAQKYSKIYSENTNLQ